MQTKKSKGVFTSRQTATQPNIVLTKQPITANSQYVHGLAADPNGPSDAVNRPHAVFIRQNGGVPLSSNQMFVPAPPERFLVESGHTNVLHQSQLPVQSNHIQSIQTVQPLFQSIKKTYIPHHIINQIPIASSETKRYEIQEAENFNDIDEPMLQQYEKLYTHFQEQRKRNEQLQRELNELKLTKQDNQDYFRNKRVDVKLLSTLILRKYTPAVRDTIQFKKKQCLNKIRSFFSEQQLHLESVLLQTTQETHWNAKRT